MTIEEQMKIVEERVLLCLEIQARMITILDVLEVGQTEKAAEAARQARELARTLHNDLWSDRKRLLAARN